jgi:hypothetical protein
LNVSSWKKPLKGLNSTQSINEKLAGDQNQFVKQIRDTIDTIQLSEFSINITTYIAKVLCESCVNLLLRRDKREQEEESL